MRRRKFCQYALGAACFVESSGRSLAFSTTAKSSFTKAHHKWVVLYWMPYDNNLSRFGEPIIEMIARGTQNSASAVAVQSDYWGDAHMRRRQVIGGIVTEIDISGEDSSDVSALASYLDWAYQAFEAEHWAVIVVGHGGKINEISPDDHRVNHQPRTWMGVDQFTNVVDNFNQAVNGRVELLFFQNCNKATLEVIYEARNSARYTLASQLTLGAPNYYYENFLKRLTSLANGREAAMAIIDAERVDMYHTLTLVDNQAVEHLPEKLSSLLLTLLSDNLGEFNQSSDIPTYSYFDEKHCDVIILLNHLSNVSNKGQREVAKFTDFINSSVIGAYQTNGELFGSFLRIDQNTLSQKLCGLGMYFPKTEQDISRYSTLALYQRIDLVNLYRLMIAG
ncbi:MAG: clostripain family protease [Leptolyngbya sp. SIO3F4]|nr:clostripain family protease [Leptolyngbya sp. SIO3F4]